MKRFVWLSSIATLALLSSCTSCNQQPRDKDSRSMRHDDMRKDDSDDDSFNRRGARCPSDDGPDEDYSSSRESKPSKEKSAAPVAEKVSVKKAERVEVRKETSSKEAASTSPSNKEIK